jgi:hypothetical protein
VFFYLQTLSHILTNGAAYIRDLYCNLVNGFQVLILSKHDILTNCDQSQARLQYLPQLKASVFFSSQTLSQILTNAAAYIQDLYCNLVDGFQLLILS